MPPANGGATANEPSFNGWTQRLGHCAAIGVSPPQSECPHRNQSAPPQSECPHRNLSALPQNVGSAKYNMPPNTPRGPLDSFKLTNLILSAAVPHQTLASESFSVRPDDLWSFFTSNGHARVSI